MTTQLIKNLLALKKALSTPPKTVRAVRELGALYEKNMRALLSLPPPEPMSLAELERLSKRGGFRVETKQQRRKREQLGTRLGKAKKAAHRRKQREVRAGLALLGGKGDHERAEIARQTWKRRLRPPAGSTETDRAVITAIWPPEWRTVRQIGERLEWARFGARLTLRGLYGPLRRLVRHGAVERMVRNGPNYRKGVRGYLATHYYRLTQAGLSLHDDIEATLVPEWSSMVRVKPRPVGENAGEAKVLCAMAPGQWWSIGDICRTLGLSWRHKLERQAIANALRRHLVPTGAVEKAQNPDWQGPGPEKPRFLYRLTAGGEQAREGLMLIG